MRQAYSALVLLLAFSGGAALRADELNLPAEKIAGGNLMRVWREAERVAREMRGKP